MLFGINEMKYGLAGSRPIGLASSLIEIRVKNGRT